jgi:hypothetical protein
MSAMDILDEAFCEPVGPDLIAGLCSIPDARIALAADRYCASALQDPEVVPMRRPDELRPFLGFTTMALLSEEHGLGLDPVELYALSDRATPEIVEDAIKHLLLYCHRLIIRDPLFDLFWQLRLGIPRNVGPRNAARRQLLNGLTIFSYLRPLIERDIVSFVASPPTLATRTPFYALLEDDEERPPAPTVRRWISGRAAIVQALEFAEQFPGSCDLLLPAEDDITVAQRMFNGRPPIPPRVRDNRVLHHLVDTEVPWLSELSVSDVVSIRDASSATSPVGTTDCSAKVEMNAGAGGCGIGAAEAAYAGTPVWPDSGSAPSAPAGVEYSCRERIFPRYRAGGSGRRGHRSLRPVHRCPEL